MKRFVSTSGTLRGAFFLSVLSCVRATPTPPTPDDSTAIRASVAAWQQAGLDYPDRCGRERETLSVQSADRWCSEWQGGCFISAWSGDALNRPRSPILAVQDDADRYRRARIVAHETLHWLGSCAATQWGADALHADPRVWGNDGDGVEANARREVARLFAE